MIVIVGGTGVMGRIVTRLLLEAGEAVRVVTRDPARAEALHGLGAEAVRGDLVDRLSIVRACEGADAVIAAAHSLFGRGRYSSEQVDLRGHRELIDTARSSGVRHFVYTSVFDFGSVYQSIPFIRIKYETERYLSASGLNYTILRPSAFMDPHAHALIGLPVVRKGKVVLFGSGRVRRNFVAPEDVARVAVMALRESSLAGRTVNLGGPENLSDLDVVRIYERLSGRTAKVRHLPISLLRIVSGGIRPLHPGLSQVLRMAVLAGRLGQTFEAEASSEQFGFEPLRLDDWARQRLMREVAPPLS